MLKQAFAARDAHEALLDLKKKADEATETAHAAELESFHLAVERSEIDGVRRTLQEVGDRLKSPKFDAVLSQLRDKLETAASIEAAATGGAQLEYEWSSRPGR